MEIERPSEKEASEIAIFVKNIKVEYAELYMKNLINSLEKKGMSRQEIIDLFKGTDTGEPIEYFLDTPHAKFADEVNVTSHFLATLIYLMIKLKEKGVIGEIEGTKTHGISSSISSSVH